MVGVGAYKAGSFLARRVPDGVATAAARMGGFGAGMMAGDAGTIVGRNLERVYGRELGAAEKRRKVAETFDRDTQVTIKRTMTLLEPMLILVLGVVIALRISRVWVRR